MEPTEVTYKGPAALAGLFVRHLESEGATVEWERPFEQRDLSSMAETYVVGMLVWGSTQGIRAAIAKFREGQPTAEIEWREDDAYR